MPFSPILPCNRRAAGHLGAAADPPADLLHVLAELPVGGAGDPLGYHAVNLALHLAAVLLAYECLRRLLPERAALVAAAIFAVHPMQAEAVNYVWARSIVLASAAAAWPRCGVDRGPPLGGGRVVRAGAAGQGGMRGVSAGCWLAGGAAMCRRAEIARRAGRHARALAGRRARASSGATAVTPGAPAGCRRASRRGTICWRKAR